MRNILLLGESGDMPPRKICILIKVIILQLQDAYHIISY